MEESISYRQAGRESPGKLHKGIILDKSDRSLTPVFGSQSSRFNIPKPSFTCNPREISPLPKHKILGCMDKSRRFKPTQYFTTAPGPGTYTLKEERKTNIIKSVFLSKEARSLSPIRQMPAPGQYNPKEITSSRSVASVFRSNVRRIHDPPKSITPAPGHYTPNFSLIHKSYTAMSYKKPTAKRYQVNVYNPLSKPLPEVSPGPGSYDIPRDRSDESIPSAVFHSAEERFGRQEELSPAPGTYEIGSNEGEKQILSVAAFRSDTERFLRRGHVPRPGPAFYKPNLLPKRRSFLLNLHQKWVG